MKLFTELTRIFGAGRGRPVAAAMVMGFAILLCLPELSPLKDIRLFLFDAYQTCLPRERLSAPATIVGIDEASLKLMGQWPWPRTQMAALIERLAAGRPAAIGLDMIMPEPDRMSPARVASSLPQIGGELRRRLETLPDNDRLLAAAMGKVSIVLGAAGFDTATPTTSSRMRASPMALRGAEAAPFVRNFPAVLKSLPLLEEAASGQALLNADLEKGIVRRVPLIARVGDTLAASLSLELLRVASGLAAIQVTADSGGIVSAGLGDVRIPTEADGKSWIHFAPSTPDRYVSAADVMAGRVNPELLEGKLVLIGLTGQGLIDVVTTPRGERIPGIEVHAQLLENIFDQAFLTRPRWMPWMESGILLLCGALLLAAVPTMKPRLSALLAILLIGSLLLLGFVLYRTAGLLFDAASLSIGAGAGYVSLLISTFVITDRERHAAQRALQLEREAAARVAGELEAARRIQMGSLPQAATAFPGEVRFDLSAILEPARVVGGDLYDFYMLDENRLFFIVADVSGKGLPASLFMVVTKAMAKSIAMQGRLNVRDIFGRLNVELAWENPEMLFVTAFAAILDVETGELEYCIAGHDAPWRISAAGKVDRLGGEGRPALCMVEDLVYPLEKMQLVSGDVICVVTDGITEAMNMAGELYGTERVTAVTEREGSHRLPAAGLLRQLREDVSAHVGQAEPSDDLTALVIRWEGPV